MAVVVVVGGECWLTEVICSYYRLFMVFLEVVSVGECQY